MRTPFVIGLVASLVMVVTLVMSVLSGDFTGQGSQILELAWGRMTLVDLYIGAALVGSWIVHRERSWLTILAWWAGLFVFGHLASAAYVTIVARSSSDWTTFWSGSNRSSSRSAAR